VEKHISGLSVTLENSDHREHGVRPFRAITDIDGSDLFKNLIAILTIYITVNSLVNQADLVMFPFVNVYQTK